MTAPPLAGCRVLDLGIITAGAATAALLADMGAEVIKVESPTYRDPFRGWAGGPVAEPGGMPPLFRATNRNKAAVSLDLKHADGRAAFLRLVAHSDVVVENFRRGVLARLCLGYATLREANADIVLASVSSQGETGPDAAYVSFGSTLEAVGGMAWLTGYADDAPAISGRDVNYPDQVAAIFAAGMIATAWGARRNGAPGCHLDLSQRELTSFLVGEAFVATPRSRDAQRALAACAAGLFPRRGRHVGRHHGRGTRCAALRALIGVDDAALDDALRDGSRHAMPRRACRRLLPPASLPRPRLTARDCWRTAALSGATRSTTPRMARSSRLPVPACRKPARHPPRRAARRRRHGGGAGARCRLLFG